MNGLREETNLNFLVGKDIEQICLGKYQVILNMSEGVSISIESQMQYTTEENDGPVRLALKPGSKDLGILQTLLHVRVDRVDIHPPGDFSMRFANGDQLLIQDSNREFESYQITGHRGVIVV